MNEVVINISNLYKEYRLGTVGRGTLYRDLQSFWANFRGKEDPNSLLVGARNPNLEKRKILAINNFNLDIYDGEVLGIIGANGAGKSTLLKILSRVTGPSKGEIKVKGRVASLLEVSTGFHPELTGRENVYLNGAINGMTKEEISKKMEKILTFAGVEKFADTPVKRYSSGMHVRLGFSVAAHLDPDILVVDEVLAVGDASFSKKALKKMDSISKEQGRTVIFVSHNLASIRSLCTRAILIENGKLTYDGSPKDTVDHYLKKISQKSKELIEEKTENRKDRKGDGRLKIRSIDFFDKNGNKITDVISGEYIEMKFFYSLNGKINHTNFAFSVELHNSRSENVVTFEGDEMGVVYNEFKKEGYISLTIPKINLRGGTYFITFVAREGMAGQGWIVIDEMSNAKELTVLAGDFWKTGMVNRSSSRALIDASIKKVDN